jgi:hypothetical protein
MQNGNPYEEARLLLVSSGFYPALATRVKNKFKIVEGLRIDSPPILKDDRGDRIRKAVGEGYVVTWMGIGDENNYFLIKKK